ncbi:MAG: hypothetical protein LBV02_08625 [Bacteroidales bacterium]|jgi:hypothetical protein|nr:hypothetical protein [Bacteroidales bacterium]
MKKILVTISIVLCTTVVAVAQPRAIGARLGGDVEFSYQHSVGSSNMLDLSAGLGLGVGYFQFGVTGMYDWLFPINSWSYAGEWTWYAGPGVGVGFRSYILENLFPLAVNVGGQIGIEYAFDFPLNLSLDYRPMINLLGFGNGYWGNLTGIALGVRYRF